MKLESTPETPVPLRQVVDSAKNWIERLGAIWAEGQLIEIKRRPGGLQYLTMRDRTEEVSVRLYAAAAVLDIAGPIMEGAEVTALIKPMMWRKSGSLMFEIIEIRPSGEGRLLAQIEQLKRKLQAEGLFAPEQKKRLPFLPNRIGLITGRDSAAERDVIENVRRRWPAAQFEIAYSLVQGSMAAGEVMARLAELEANPAVDVIIIARGGGSLEDLLPFSDEGLVRAVFAATTPVISAIGHEPDTPILDLVADLRASTPTDAAKRVVPDVIEERRGLAQALDRVRQSVSFKVMREQQTLDDWRRRPVLRDPSAALTPHFERVSVLKQRMWTAMATQIRHDEVVVEQTLSRIRSLSPKATLQRGYAILVDENRDSITTTAQARVGQTVTARLADGTLTLDITDVNRMERK